MKKNARRVTVTYGAFSVSLEGYDDPVEAVKAIAERFREIAGQTPQFGAPLVMQAAQAVPQAIGLREPETQGAAFAPDDADADWTQDAAAFFRGEDQTDHPPRTGPLRQGADTGQRAATTAIVEDDGAVGELEAILRRLEARKAALAQAQAAAATPPEAEPAARSDEPTEPELEPGPGTAPEAARPAPQRAAPHDLASDVGEDVTRLMARTDQQMQEPDGQTRRNAFAHLRAAVVARTGDTSLAVKAQVAEDTARAYRGDLADVVSNASRPRDRFRLGNTDGSAPLKLCADQRIDRVK